MFKEMMDTIGFVTQADPEVGAAMEAELKRQRGNIELIASENIVSPAVMAAMGSVLTNKYAEGYPGHRYYHGSPVNMSGKNYNFIAYGVDENGYLDYADLEKKAKEHQPKMIVAGASAYSRTIDFERIAKIARENGALFMVDMAHIAGLVAAGLHPNPVPYADVVTTTTHKTLRGPRGGLILCREEYAKAIDKAIFPGTQGGPLEHIIAAKAVCFGEALRPEFKEYQKNIAENARVLAQALLDEGLGLVSGGTDNHLMTVDLRGTGVTGKELERRLDEVHITANKNTVPNDPEKPFVTSGVRIGTPAVTTRGFGPEEMRKIAKWIAACTFDFEAQKEAVAAEVAALTARFPLYE